MKTGKRCIVVLNYFFLSKLTVVRKKHINISAS